MLYTSAVFRYAIDYQGSSQSPPPSQACTERMMNVDFILDQSYFDDQTRNWPKDVRPSKLTPFAETTMGRFTGSDIRRKTCGVLLWAIEYENRGNRWLSSPMAQAIRQMTGFEHITIEIEDQNVSLAYQWEKADSYEMPYDSPEEDSDGEAVAGKYSPQDGSDNEESVAGFDSPRNTGGSEQDRNEVTNCVGDFAEQIRSSFAAELGPGGIFRVVNGAGVSTGLYVEFQPQKHHQVSSKVEGGAGDCDTS